MCDKVFGIRKILDFCGKFFGTTLKLHSKIVQKINDRNGFGYKSSFRKHTTRVHENLRQFMCDICYKAFGLRKTSEMHEKVVSFNYKSCDESFIQKFNFVTHINSVHENQTCGKTFQNILPQDSHF